MEEKKSRRKKKIIPFITSLVMAFSVLTMNVSAADVIFDYSYNRSFLLPWTYCGTDFTVSESYEEEWLCNLKNDDAEESINLSSKKYYFFISTGAITVTDTEYYQNSDGCRYEPYGYFLYGGQKYYFADDGYCTFVQSGTYYYTLPYYLGCNVTVSPYHADGYYYANGFRCRINQNMRLRVYELGFTEVASEIQLSQLNDKLAELNEYMSSSVSLQETYYPKLTEMLLRLTHIDLDIDEVIGLLDTLVAEIEKANISLDNIEHWTEHQYSVLLDISEELVYLTENLLAQNSVDKDTTDSFKEESDSQSNALNDLNEQTQVDRIDVDNASGTVDSNLDVEVDANYGVLLSTFTENKNILTMLLAVASMGLISYVLFGKR